MLVRNFSVERRKTEKGAKEKGQRKKEEREMVSQQPSSTAEIR
jgi:hypothetical protein